MVVDHRMRSTHSRKPSTSSKPSCVAPCVRQSNKPTVKSCGVVSTLTEKTPPSRLNIPSVRVPPTSMSTVSTDVSSSGCSKRSEKIVRFPRPAEKHLPVIYGRLVRRRRTRRHGTVAQQNWPVVQEISVAQGRFDTNVGCDPRKEKVPDTARAQHRIQGSTRDAAVSRLDYDQVRGLRFEVLDHVEIPGSFGEQLPFEFGPPVHQPHGPFFVPIRRVRPNTIALVRLVPHLQMNYWDGTQTSAVQHLRDLPHNRRGAGNIHARNVQHPTLACESVLHVHNDERGFIRVDLNGLRLRVHPDHAQPTTAAHRVFGPTVPSFQNAATNLLAPSRPPPKH